MTKTARAYEGSACLATARRFGQPADEVVGYFACSVCKGVQDHNRKGKKLAEDCCSEHKAAR